MTNIVLDEKDISSEQKSQKSYELESILNEIGSFGRFHFYIFFLVGFPLFISGFFSVGFALTASDLNYRCEIPNCETSEYKPSWLENAVPFKNKQPAQCERYEFVNETNNNIYDSGDDHTCDNSELFDKTKILKCDKFIYETNEITILNEFGLQCDENKWKLALVGTLHNAAHFINLLVTGYISDTYGRLKVLVGSAIASATFGIIRSFSWDYVSFIIFEMLDAGFGAGIYTAGFILAMEFFTSEYRSVGILIFTTASFGKVALGLSAMWLLNFRTLLRVWCIPALLIISYLWFAPESVRWLLTKKQNKKAAQILLKAAKMNKKQLSPETLDLLENNWDKLTLSSERENQESNENQPPANKYELKEIFKHPLLLLRIAICAYAWTTNVFVFYGLTLTAVSIGGNKFLDFTITSAIELPASFLTFFICQKVGRKFLVCGSFILSGIALLTSAFTPDIYWLNLLLFLIGKFAITTSFGTIYIYTSELFPTSLRHTLIGFVSAVARIGSVIAPQAPLLGEIYESLPMILFGVTSFSAGLLTLKFPETLNCKMPDTIEECLAIGKKKDKKTKTETKKI